MTDKQIARLVAEYAEPHVREAYHRGLQQGRAEASREIKTYLKAFSAFNGSGNRVLAALDALDGTPEPEPAVATKAAPPPGRGDPHAAIAEAMLRHAAECHDAGDDPTAGLDALAALADDPESLGEVLGRGESSPGAVAKAVAAVYAKAWSEQKHPRDDHGRWVAASEIRSAAADPKKLEQLRASVTDPEQRAKLDAAVASAVVPGRGRASHFTPEFHYEEGQRHAGLLRGDLIAKVKAGDRAGVADWLARAERMAATHWREARDKALTQWHDDYSAHPNVGEYEWAEEQVRLAFGNAEERTRDAYREMADAATRLIDGDPAARQDFDDAFEAAHYGYKRSQDDVWDTVQYWRDRLGGKDKAHTLGRYFKGLPGAWEDERDAVYFKAAAWRSELHPRSKNGRFISRQRLQEAHENPDGKVAKELRKEVKPEDRAKLEHAIGSGVAHLGGMTQRDQSRHRARQRREARKLLSSQATDLVQRLADGQGTAEDVATLASHLKAQWKEGGLNRDHIGYLTHVLNPAAKRSRRRAEMVDALLGHARGATAAPEPEPTPEPEPDRRSPAERMARDVDPAELDRVYGAPTGGDESPHRREQSGEEAATGAGGDFRFPASRGRSRHRDTFAPAAGDVRGAGAGRPSVRDFLGGAGAAGVPSDMPTAATSGPPAGTPDTTAPAVSGPPAAKPDRPKVEYVRAGAGGQVSDVDGKFYAGGQLMPVHGKYSGMQKPPPGAGVGTADPVKANEDSEGEAGSRRPPARPLTPEQIEEKRREAEDQRKWDEMNRGPLGRVTWLGDKPNHRALDLSKQGTRLDHWREFAERVGPAGVKHIIDTLEPEFHGSIDQWGGRTRADHAAKKEAGNWNPTYDRDLDADHEDWLKNQPKERAAESVGMMRGGKGHEKQVPGSHYARQLVHEMMDPQNNGDRRPVDILHRLNGILADAERAKDKPRSDAAAAEQRQTTPPTARPQELSDQEVAYRSQEQQALDGDPDALRSLAGHYESYAQSLRAGHYKDLTPEERGRRIRQAEGLAESYRRDLEGEELKIRERKPQIEEQIFNHLSDTGKPLTAHEIGRGIGLTRGHVRSMLEGLAREGEIYHDSDPHTMEVRYSMEPFPKRGKGKGKPADQRRAEQQASRARKVAAGGTGGVRPAPAAESGPRGLAGVLGVYRSATGRAKEFIGNGLSNLNPHATDADPAHRLKTADPQHLAEGLVAAWRDAHTHGSPADLPQIEAAMAHVPGLERVGETGEETAFDGSRHAHLPGLFTGHRVRVTRPGWQLDRGDGTQYAILKTQVEPAGAGGEVGPRPAHPAGTRSQSAEKADSPANRGPAAEVAGMAERIRANAAGKESGESVPTKVDMAGGGGDTTGVGSQPATSKPEGGTMTTLERPTRVRRLVTTPQSGGREVGKEYDLHATTGEFDAPGPDGKPARVTVEVLRTPMPEGEELARARRMEDLEDTPEDNAVLARKLARVGKGKYVVVAHSVSPTVKRSTEFQFTGSDPAALGADPAAVVAKAEEIARDIRERGW